MSQSSNWSGNPWYYPGYFPYRQAVFPQSVAPSPYQAAQPYSHQQVPLSQQLPSGSAIQTPSTGAGAQQVPGMLPLEQSYIENILRLNRGKFITVYMTFENNVEWNAKIFRGIIEAAGRDHLIISDPETGKRYLLPMVYFNYAEFDEELNYYYPYSTPPLATYQPR
ncbi:spore coat protein GerQ [Caldibacillus debilis]|uniref:Spore coat protein GerQ n=1 Tax=Caldibacillus debilis TaxID=301148 RepID=A0A150M5Q9_9BACI|nr:spore coat protein GerQ [Caldibacillus debilis]KYD19944.1 hypothetical protein B4135_0843 [Caldibacillus debilis]